MIFSELYGAYYNTVAKVLKAAIDHPLRKGELRKIVEETAFGESILNIEPALREGRWQLLLPDGTTPVRNEPTMPLTTVQKQWLKAIISDPRMRLFTDELPAPDNVEPLFTQADYCVYDRYSDGDPYEDPAYIEHFRRILDAVRNHYPLIIEVKSRRNTELQVKMLPEYLEYSEKDDKFRVVGRGSRYGHTLNLSRIISCERYEGWFEADSRFMEKETARTVELELTNRRNALERVLLHFAHFEKEAERLDEDRYLVRIRYEKDDETELLIRVLSFGPMVKVTSPQNFIDLIKERLINQKSCEQ